MRDKGRLLGKGARAKVSAYVMIVLTAVKMSVGLLSGSIALLADAVHSLSCLLTSFFSSNKGFSCVCAPADTHTERVALTIVVSEKNRIISHEY